MDDTTYARGVGGLVRAAREAGGLTQARLSELTGIAVPHLSRLEAGTHLPSLKTMKKVAEGLGVAVGELLPDGSPKARKPKG